jgi:hypothetical protein
LKLRRILGAAIAALILSVSFSFGWNRNPLDTYSFRITGKAWVTVPEEYRRPHSSRVVCVGAWENMTKSRQGMLYLHAIERMGWKYALKDRYGRGYTLFSGRDWLFSVGDTLLITGEISSDKVFIPQGVYVYE